MPRSRSSESSSVGAVRRAAEFGDQAADDVEHLPLDERRIGWLTNESGGD